MATNLDRTFRIDASPQAVMDVMRDPAFIEESEKSRDALEVRVVDKKQDDATHEYEIHTKTYARTVKGIDKNKVDDNRTDVTWNLGARSGRWTFHGPHGPKVRVTGAYALKEAGGGTDLRLTCDIEIGIPVVGRMIEKKVKEGFESNWPPYVERIKKHLSGG